jgi:hypothetical protein
MSSSRQSLLPWLTLAVLFLITVPLFLRMPPTVDVAFYGVCAETLRHGGILDRDVLMLQPPGMAWIVAGIHALIGQSVIGLRVVDLLILANIVALLVRWQRDRVSPGWLALALSAFYLTTSEWNHAQPDLWMLLPALMALALRRQSLQGPSPAWLALLEGLLWGSACLIKPFVLLPGGACWLMCAGWAWRETAAARWALARQAVLVFFGGALIGLAWAGWLWLDGGWPFYLKKLADWSGRYYSVSTPLRQRFWPIVGTFPPWGIAHVIAMPSALSAMVRSCRDPEAGKAMHPPALLGVFYLGWLFQANFLQSQHDYHILPSTLLSIAVAAGAMARLTTPLPARLALAAGLLVSILLQPALAPGRLTLWSACLTQPTTPHLWNALTLDPKGTPDWEELARVEAFLREQEVGDGELSCFGMTTAHLYTHLRVKPATRYLFLSYVLYLYPQRAGRVLAEVQRSGQRFIVTDLGEASLTRAQMEEPGENPTALPPAFPGAWQACYPWSLPPVFRAGRYVVHAAH